MITAFRHTGIVVSDMDTALKFYKDMLELKLVVDTVEESEHVDKILGLSSVRLRIVKLSIGNGILLELLFQAILYLVMFLEMLEKIYIKTKNGDTKVIQVNADNNVIIISDQGKAFANRGIYFVEEKIIELY